MIILGLTGSIGMGKSTTAAMFRACGVPVYDADAAVHRLYAGPAVAEIAQIFPESLVDGQIDRAKLAAHVLNDAAALKSLEEIIHPLVDGQRRLFLDRCAATGAKICVLDIPLLFETGGERQVDATIVVWADAATQESRVLAREGMTREKFEAIKAKQFPDAQKRRRAHFVVDTGKGLAYADRQVKQLLQTLGV